MLFPLFSKRNLIASQTDMDGNKMNVPPQCIAKGCVEGEPSKEDKLATWIMVGIASAIVAAIVVFVIGAICYKMQTSRGEKVAPLIVSVPHASYIVM